MTNRITYLFALMLVVFASANVVNAQESSSDDTWTKAMISDDMTVDPDLNAKWRSGDYGYSSKPKNAFEVGVHLGHFHINGDVQNDPFKGFGVGLHVRKAINYVLSWRVQGMYSTTSGVDGRTTSRAVLALDNPDVVSKLPESFTGTKRTFRAKNLQGSVDLVVNIGNLLFHKPRNKWNLYAGMGMGLTKANVTMNYLNGDTPYDYSKIDSDNPDNTKAKRNAIRDLLDDSFESVADNNRNVFGGIFDNGLIFPSFVASVGLSRKINKRINLTIEHQYWTQDFDKWDGHVYRTTADQTNDSDNAHYTNLRLGINLGNMSKVTEPLYWLNPLDAAYNDIADLKKRPILDLTDADEDGVLDFMDNELNTVAGSPVDTKGVALDSDGDGIIDVKDAEPYSPPGFEIDNKGVAVIPDAGYLKEGDVSVIVDNKINGLRGELAESACGKWFLPMIHFDLDKYYIKPEYYGQLHHVADVMKKCPNLCVRVQGHTDSRNSNDYNRVLSYNRAKAAVDYLISNYSIDRSRLKLTYGGEENPLIKNVPQRGGANVAAQQYMNRRVEFNVCEAGDSDMGRPEGPEAGSGYRKGGNYGGNKNSGF